MKDSLPSPNPDWVDTLLTDPLVLPEDMEFQSVPAKLSLEQMIALSEKSLPFINSRPDFIQMKLKRPFNVPFEL